MHYTRHRQITALFFNEDTNHFFTHGFSDWDNEFEDQKLFKLGINWYKKEEEDLRTKIDKQEEKANNGNKTIHRFLDREESGEVDPAWSVIRRAIDEKFANKQHSSGTGRKDKLKKKITSAGQGKSQFLPDQLTNLSSQERSLVERIYQIIRSVLPPDQSADLVRVIQKKLESK